MLSVFMQSVFMLRVTYVECIYTKSLSTECRYAESHLCWVSLCWVSLCWKSLMLSVFMLSVFMLNAECWESLMLSIFMLNLSCWVLWRLKTAVVFLLVNASCVTVDGGRLAKSFCRHLAVWLDWPKFGNLATFYIGIFFTFLPKTSKHGSVFLNSKAVGCSWLGLSNWALIFWSQFWLHF